MANAFVIPFRCRGTDPLRSANLNFVHSYVEQLELGPVYVVSDKRHGSEPFCRHASYNIGSEVALSAGATTITYYEADMIVPRSQLVAAIAKAETDGLVIPFTERRELGPSESEQLRTGLKAPADCIPDVVKRRPRRSGAVNVISRRTLESVGRWDDQFQGSHWDDRSMLRAFDVCAGPTDWVPGPSWTLYHLPGYTGSHLTDEDRAATAANRRRYSFYLRANTPEQIRALTLGHA